jgi:hypothetical protein
MSQSHHNPYAPPKAPVDEAPLKSSGVAPDAVKLAVKLMWVSFFLTFVEMALDWAGTFGEAPLGFLLIFTVPMSALQVWLILMIARGRNWARITMLVLFVISMSLLLMEMPDLMRRAPFAATITALDLAIAAYAFYLIFFPGRAWFRRSR